MTNLFRHLYLLLWQSDYSLLINIFCDKIYCSAYMKVFIDFVVWWRNVFRHVYKYISEEIYFVTHVWLLETKNFVTFISYRDKIISSSMINICDIYSSTKIINMVLNNYLVTKMRIFGDKILFYWWQKISSLN